MAKDTKIQWSDSTCNPSMGCDGCELWGKDRKSCYAAILLYTASPGAEGSLGGLVEVGRRLERYLAHALDLGRLCSNDPVCAAHLPDHEIGGGDRYLEGASCHGCLLISEPSCERMNTYLDRTLVVPTVESSEAAFFRG